MSLETKVKLTSSCDDQVLAKITSKGKSGKLIAALLQLPAAGADRRGWDLVVASRLARARAWSTPSQ